MPDLSEVAGLVAGAIAVVLLAVLAVVALATRPRRPEQAPTTPELPDGLAPAIANLLTEGFEPTREAAAATLLDLAARRHLAIDQHVDGTVVLRLRRAPRPGPLAPFESHVLDHLRARAHDGVVPAQALAFASDADANRWWKGLRRAIVGAASDQGLCRPRWPGWVRGLTVLGTVACGALVVGFDRDESATTVAESVGYVALIVLGVASALLVASTRQRDTPAGRAAAGAWTGVRAYLADNSAFEELPPAAVILWDRYLAYAAAFGLADACVEQLPLGTEDDHRAWSTATGSWRRVEVRYPRLTPGWGRQPARAVLSSLVKGAVAAVVAAVALRLALDPAGEIDAAVGATVDAGPARWITLGAGAVATLAASFVLLELWVLVLAAPDLVARTRREGVVVRARRKLCPTPDRTSWVSGWHGPGEDDPDPHRKRDRCFLAVDDGSRRRIDALAVRQERWDGIGQGDTVRVELSPRLRWVRSLTVVARARPGAGDHTVAVPGGAGQDVDPTSVATARLAELAAGLAASHQAPDEPPGATPGPSAPVT